MRTSKRSSRAGCTNTSRSASRTSATWAFASNAPTSALLDRVDPRRTQPRHALPLRPAGAAGPSGHTPAPRAARANACARVLDADRAREALHQLAAGPAVELPRANRSAREDARVRDPDRSRRLNVGDQPVRLLPRAASGQV